VFDTTRAAVNLVFTGSRERFPEIRFILAHAGGTLPYLAMRLALAPMIEASLQNMTREQILAGLRSFWYDNAIASGAQTMGALSGVAAKERILFGSDWPFCDSLVVSEEIAQLTAPDFLTADMIAMIERQNALALFPRRAAPFK
jgi:predicted TIM-barrel fold metal-dependent hydrolase